MDFMGMPLLKIVVGGPYNSGKSTTIRSLDPNATSLERKQADGQTTTVGFDSGKMVLYNQNGTKCIIPKQEYDLQKNGIKDCEETTMVVLFGCAGQMRFNDVRKATMRGAKGVLFVVDSTNPGHIGHCVALFEEIRIILGENIPLVVLANKQDFPEAMNAQKVKELLSIDSAPVFETSALTGVGVKEALIKLLQLISESHAGLKGIDDPEVRNLAFL